MNVVSLVWLGFRYVEVGFVWVFGMWLSLGCVGFRVVGCYFSEHGRVVTFGDISVC